MENNNEFNYSSDTKFKKAIPVNKASTFRNVASSFITGALGASVVICTCFGVPSIKNKLLSQNASHTISSITSDTGISEKSFINLEEYSNTATSVASTVLPSVVGITVNYSVSSFFGESEAKATGSGIILSNDGYIVTNNHVIASESSSSFYQITEANSITVKLYNDSNEYEAKVVGKDKYTDLAILKIEAENLIPAKIGNSEDLTVGEFAMAIGNPLGLDTTVTSGIISALNREVTDDEGNTYTTIQTDAAINSGNSGGALVNSKGELIGINSLKLSGSGVEGIGFAIPISSVTNVINQLISNGSVIRPYIGIAGSDISESIATRYNIPQGVYIESVEENSPAAEAKLKKGDIITAINDNEIKTISELNKIKYTYNIGDTITLTVHRDNKDEKIDIKLTEEPKSEESSQNSNNSQDLPRNYEEFFRDFNLR